MVTSILVSRPSVSLRIANECPVKGCTSPKTKTPSHTKTGESMWRWTCTSTKHPQEVWFHGPCYNCSITDTSHNRCKDCNWHICRHCEACDEDGCSRNDYRTIKGVQIDEGFSEYTELRACLDEAVPKLRDPLQHKHTKRYLKQKISEYKDRRKAKVKLRENEDRHKKQEALKGSLLDACHQNSNH
jgi:hypothetical protein